MKKIFLVTFLMQSILLGNAFSAQDDGALTIVDKPSAPPSRSGQVPIIMPKKEKGVAPKVIVSEKKQHVTKPGVAKGNSIKNDTIKHVKPGEVSGVKQIKQKTQAPDKKAPKQYIAPSQQRTVVPAPKPTDSKKNGAKAVLQ